MTAWSNPEYIHWVYRSLLGREADPDGLQHFVSLLENGVDLKIVVDAILSGEEYKSKTRPRDADPLHLLELQRRPIVIVDVGARLLDSEDHIYAPLTTGSADWRCIGFEPQKHRIAERAAIETDPRLQLIEAFIGDGSEATFYSVNDDGSSSLLPLNLPFNADFDDISRMRIVGSDKIKTTTLDDALTSQAHIDFLKFDIQGFEARALKGATEVLRRTNVIHCEVFFAPMYHDSAMFTDIEAILHERNFEFIDFHHLNRYQYATVPIPTGERERLIWGDAVFFRKDAGHRDDLVAQALIANFVYKKLGLTQSIVKRLQNVSAKR